MTARTRRSLALLFVAVMMLMIVDDVRAMIHLQRTLPCDLRLCRTPRDLERFTRGYHDPKISATWSHFYLLREMTPGATVTIPPYMDAWDGYFIEVARMRPVRSVAVVVIDDSAIKRLTAAATHNRRWLRRGGSRPLYQDLYIVYDPHATQYVWAETSSSYFGPIFLISEEEYARSKRGTR